jgi:hypothetical protein
VSATTGASSPASWGIAPIGVHKTQIWLSEATSVASKETVGKNLRAFSADWGERAHARTFQFGRRDCNASASEPPIRPGPKMATVLRGQGRFYSCMGT